MKNFCYLKYLKNLTFLMVGLVLFLLVPGALAQEKATAPTANKTFRIKIFKEKGGKMQMLDTTLTAEEMAKFKNMPGDWQTLLKEVDAIQFNPGELREPVVRIIKPAQPLSEKRVEVWRRADGTNFVPDSGRHIIYRNQTLHPLRVMPDSLRDKLLKLRENVNFRVISPDSGQLREIWLNKIDNQDIQVIRLMPLTQVMVDTVRLVENLNITDKPGKLVAVRKILIKDLEKLDAPLLNKINTPAEINLTEDLRINNMRYYPNPNQGRFTLSFKVPQAGDMAIKIYDQLGREIYQENYQYFSGDYQKVIDISKAKSGVYFLKIIQGDSAYTKKLVID